MVHFRNAAVVIISSRAPHPFQRPGLVRCHSDNGPNGFAPGIMHNTVLGAGCGVVNIPGAITKLAEAAAQGRCP